MGKADFIEWIKADFREWSKADSTYATSQQTLINVFSSPFNPILGAVGFPLIWAALRPTRGSLPIDPLIDIPKGVSSKMTLEVAARRLKVFPCYKLKT